MNRRASSLKWSSMTTRRLLVQQYTTTFIFQQSKIIAVCTLIWIAVPVCPASSKQCLWYEHCIANVASSSMTAWHNNVAPIGLTAAQQLKSQRTQSCLELGLCTADLFTSFRCEWTAAKSSYSIAISFIIQHQYIVQLQMLIEPLFYWLWERRVWNFRTILFCILKNIQHTYSIVWINWNATVLTAFHYTTQCNVSSSLFESSATLNFGRKDSAPDPAKGANGN